MKNKTTTKIRYFHSDTIVQCTTLQYNTIECITFTCEKSVLEVVLNSILASYFIVILTCFISYICCIGV